MFRCETYFLEYLIILFLFIFFTYYSPPFREGPGVGLLLYLFQCQLHDLLHRQFRLLLQNLYNDLLRRGWREA